MDQRTQTRRTVLRLCGLGVAASLAGCSGQSGDSAETTPTDNPGGTTESATTDATASETTAARTTETTGKTTDETTTTVEFPSTQQAELAAADGDEEDVFGESVALSSDGTTALVGAPNDEDPNGDLAGSAYVFEL